MRHYYILGISVELWLVWPLLAAIIQVPVMAIANWLGLGWLTTGSYLLFVFTMAYLMVFMAAVGVNRLIEALHERTPAGPSVEQPAVIRMMLAVQEKGLIGAALIPAGIGFPLAFLSRVTGVDWIGWLGLGLAFIPLIASFALAFSIPRTRSDDS